MLVRYGRDKKGKTKPLAQIYIGGEHHIDFNLIDKDALRIIRRLEAEGYEAYIVGGAVRDLLVGKTPKDFDIATSALPRNIKQLFRNSRIIGRRFRLVHVFYGDKIIEVSTFRSGETGNGDDNNIYGTLEEDVKRRDFSLNALYYSPTQEYVIDYVGGVRDIRNRKMRSLIPLDRTFVEDPVRLIRAVKYSVNTGCGIPFFMARAIKRFAPELERCPHSRLTEEVFKILQCGNSCAIVERLDHYGLLAHVLPVIHQAIQVPAALEAFSKSLGALDAQVAGEEEVPRWKMLEALVEPFLVIPREYPPGSSVFLESYKEIKRIIVPITPPNRDVELAVRSLLKKKGIKGGRKFRDRLDNRESRNSRNDRSPAGAGGTAGENPCRNTEKNPRRNTEKTDGRGGEKNPAGLPEKTAAGSRSRNYRNRRRKRPPAAPRENAG